MNVRSVSQRAIALLLSLVLLTGMLPVGALAAETEPTTTTVSTEATESSPETTEPSGSFWESVKSSWIEKSDPKNGDTPSEETTAPSTEATEPSTEATEPSTEATEPSTEATEPKVVAVTGITLDQTALEVGVGELPITLTAAVTPEDATDKTVTWTSSEPGVASVENGVLTFGYMGEAVITAAAGDFTATCTVKVGDGDWGTYDENTTYVLAGGDFQEAGDHANSAANVTNILAQVSQKYTTMDGFLFIGDYDCETHDDSTETASGIAALMGAVQGTYSNLNHDNSVLVQGNHDTMDSNIDSTGGHDFKGYAAYVLNEDDYPNGGGSSTGVQALADNLKSWLDDKIAEQYSEPIFITSHLPLAFTPRTVTQGDAKYAKYIFDVLNEAGKNGLNIIFLHGHDHAYGPDNYMGGEAIYLAEGDKICIAEAGSTSAWTEETLNFTYMNAGYTGYYSDAYTYNTTAGTDKLTMTVFAITDNEVTVERYSEDGLYNLKSAGYDGSYSNTSVTNLSLGLPKYSNVYTSPQTIALTAVSSGSDLNGEYIEITTGGSAATPGTTTYTYTLDTDGIDYSESNKYIIVARNAAYLLDAGNAVAVTISSDGKTATTSTDSYEYYFTTGGLITRDGTNTLYQQNWGIHVGNVSGSNLNGFTNLGSGYYRIYDTDGTARSLYYGTNSTVTSNAWTVTESNHTSSTYSVRLYKLTGTETSGGTEAVPGETAYYKADGDSQYTVAMDTSADDALAAVKAGITVYKAEDANGTNSTVLDDSAVTWTWVDAYDGTNAGPYTVKISYGGTTLGTVEVAVDVQYDTEIAEGWTHVGTSEGGYKYVLDTDGYETGSGNKYLFVASNAAYAMDEDGSGVVPVTFNDDETEAIVDSRDYEWYIMTYRSGRTTYYPVTKNGSTWIYHENYGMHVGTNDNGYWSINENDQDEGLYRFSNVDNSTWYLYYDSADNRMEVSTSSSNRVRLYKYDGEIEGSEQYVKLEGNTVYTVANGTSASAALNKIKAGITGYISSNADGSDYTELQDSELTLTWKNTYNGKVAGNYYVDISYNGVVLGTVQVTVGEPGEVTVNNYPEYPNEGAVKVNKTATGIDFQSSGIAQVEVSASGVPIKKGADVIVMLDTSSSMTSWCICGTQNCSSSGSSHQRRSAVLEESLKDLISQFKTPGDDGELLDIRVAIADFNGFYSSGAIARDSDDTMADNISYSATSEAKVYTGDGTLGYGAFIDAADLSASYTLNYTSGTNYDYAFDAIYQLGEASRANGEDRDLFVIFMSDGAAMQWNYYHSQGQSDTWGEWITGTYAQNELAAAVNCDTHTYYYNTDDTNGDGLLNEHRMANAIKGAQNDTFAVIRKATGGIDNLAATDQTNIYTVPGLGATMFSIAFDPNTDGNVETHYMTTSIATLASEQTGTTQYYYEVDSADELSNAFTSIGSEIAYAANNARFVDQMGDNYNLQMAVSNYSVVDGTSTTAKTITPKIEIIQYDIYTRQDYVNGTITEDKIGDRKGTYTILETVTFSEDGTKAYSDKIGGGTTNILADGTQAGFVKGVIYAQTFLYNTNATDVAVDGVNIPTGTNSDGTTTGSTNVLPSETFYWKMGTVQTSELAMRYYVYLEGSMEGTREGGSYPTNEYATLYYDNYLGNPCYKDTVSPVMAWKEANVSYAFYLVDENGNIIVNQTTGQTGSFANKIAVTNPVVYETVLLNNDEEVSSIDIASLGVLPEGYTLYDYDGTNGATYTVTINSNTTGEWAITSTKEVATTYVMQYDPSNAAAYSNEKAVETVGYDYTHTVVWFAVLWKVQALPDTVVIDYGLPVDISVLTNDMFGENGKLAGVGAYSDSLNLDGHDTALASGFGTTYTGTYGTAKAETSTGEVRYTPANMEMNGYDKFAYAVNYTGTTNPGYYYDTVTVIPATTIYYEDSFVDLKSYTWDSTTNGWAEKETSLWSVAGQTIGGVQDEDRPGRYSLTDANNIYGYDSVNKSMSTYSMGSAMKATVDYDNKGVASFTFYGTGFDIISMTNNTTGSIYVEVLDANGNRVGTKKMVDTYYGCKQEAGDADGDGTIEDGEVVWVVDPESTDSLYQVPVIKVNDLSYAKYTVNIEVIWETIYDNVEGSEGYDFYLDAIRIYDPANDGAVDNDSVIEDAYKADGEGWPSYVELRNGLIDEGTLGNAATDTVIEGLVFIDGDASVGDAQISDYISYGPNNEVYLAAGQRVAFKLKVPSNIANVHIGIKSADGKTGTYTITNIAQASNEETGVEAGDYYNAKTSTIDTTTDMYYDITGYQGDIIVISNTGDKYNTTGIISLTNIKFTYDSDPGENEATIYVTQKMALLTLRSLNAAALEDAPDESVPEVSEPEESAPETTVPEETVPETTEPAESVPETTVPEETKPVFSQEQVTETVKEIVNTVVNALKNLFGGWFR